MGTRTEQGFRKPWDIYRMLELGRGGSAMAPARDAKAAVRARIRNKHGK